LFEDARCGIICAHLEKEFLMKTNAFAIESTSRHDEFIDIDCVDGAAKADLRAWRVTIDCDAATVYGVLRRSKDVETPFDDGVDLPRRMVRFILSAIAMDEGGER
jgi:hypothetical protein